MPPEVERKLAAIMFTNIVGYTALMAESERGLAARHRHRELIRPLVEQFNGEAIEARGDESLSLFGSAVDAIDCARHIQSAATREGLQLHIGIHTGIHTGEVVLEGGAISGDAVNIASRRHDSTKTRTSVRLTTARTTDQRLAYVDLREKSTLERLFHRDILGNR